MSGSQPVGNNAPLPPGWEMKFDPTMKRWFFINHATKETTWKDPRQGASAKDAAEKLNRRPSASTSSATTATASTSGASSVSKESMELTELGSSKASASAARLTESDIRRLSSDHSVEQSIVEAIATTRLSKASTHQQLYASVSQHLIAMGFAKKPSTSSSAGKTPRASGGRSGSVHNAVFGTSLDDLSDDDSAADDGKAAAKSASLQLPSTLSPASSAGKGKGSASKVSFAEAAASSSSSSSARAASSSSSSSISPAQAANPTQLRPSSGSVASVPEAEKRRVVQSLKAKFPQVAGYLVETAASVAEYNETTAQGYLSRQGPSASFSSTGADYKPTTYEFTASAASTNPRSSSATATQSYTPAVVESTYDSVSRPTVLLDAPPVTPAKPTKPAQPKSSSASISPGNTKTPKQSSAVVNAAGSAPVQAKKSATPAPFPPKKAKKKSAPVALSSAPSAALDDASRPSTYKSTLASGPDPELRQGADKQLRQGADPSLRSGPNKTIRVGSDPSLRGSLHGSSNALGRNPSLVVGSMYA